MLRICFVVCFYVVVFWRIPLSNLLYAAAALMHVALCFVVVYPLLLGVDFLLLYGDCML